jgi:Spy/CpxP family protein refolding chaperone
MNMKRALIALASGLLLVGTIAAQPYGMGRGMMEGPGGYGMGMGPGMMWGGYGGNALTGLDLSADQRKQIAAIQEELTKAHWQLMGKMHEQGNQMYGGFGPGSLDEAAARKAFSAMSTAQKDMFELSVAARKRIDAVLTPAQREQLRGDWSAR